MYQALLLLRCCGSVLVDKAPSERNSLMQEIQRVVTRAGVLLDISHFNAMLKVDIL